MLSSLETAVRVVFAVRCRAFQWLLEVVRFLLRPSQEEPHIDPPFSRLKARFIPAIRVRTNKLAV